MSLLEIKDTDYGPKSMASRFHAYYSASTEVLNSPMLTTFIFGKETALVTSQEKLAFDGKESQINQGQERGKKFT
jgi:hypothetical protein